MSLITRCPACGTMFKVVTDQLKVSQGWVRCGHCTEVFDASLHLQADMLAPAPAPVEVTRPGAAEAMAALPGESTWPHSSSPVSVSPSPASQWPSGLQAEGEPAWSPGASFADRFGHSVPSVPHDPGPESSGFDPVGWKLQSSVPPALRSSLVRTHSPEEASRPAPAANGFHASRPENNDSVSAGEEFPDSTPPDAESALPSEMPHDVSFVRDARRKALWRRPVVRVALGLLTLLLSAVLVMQVAIQQRDSLAALRPELKPALEVVCIYAKCEVRPVRRIESIVIDSSSFNKITADAYRLSFSLKNAGSTPLAIPSLEVTLTDTQDQALVRRVLSPAQFGAAAATLNAGADFSGALSMKVFAAEAAGAAPAPLRVAGYRMLAFYP